MKIVLMSFAIRNVLEGSIYRDGFFLGCPLLTTTICGLRRRQVGEIMVCVEMSWGRFKNQHLVEVCTGIYMGVHIPCLSFEKFIGHKAEGW